MITPKTQNIDIERSILVRYKFRNQNLAKSNICSSTERNLSNGCINILLLYRKTIIVFFNNKIRECIVETDQMILKGCVSAFKCRLFQVIFSL